MEGLGHRPGLQGGVAIGFELFFPAGEEPEDVGEAVEEAGDFGGGDGLFGGCEVDGWSLIHIWPWRRNECGR